VAKFIKIEFEDKKVWKPKIYEGNDRKKKRASERSLALLKYLGFQGD